MRDFLLSEAIKRLATEAATRLQTLVADGEEIPFDVAPSLTRTRASSATSR